MALTKVTETALYSITSVSSNVASIGSGVDVSTYYGVNVRIRFGRGTGTALTVSPTIRLQGVYKTSSPTANDWTTLHVYKPGVGATIGSQAQSSGGASGSNSITLAAGTNFAARDFCFFHNTTLANSEFQWVQSVSGAVLTLIDNLVNSQSGSTVRNQAEEYNQFVDCTSLEKLRLVVDNSGTGQAIIVEAGFGAVSGL